LEFIEKDINILENLDYIREKFDLNKPEQNENLNEQINFPENDTEDAKLKVEEINQEESKVFFFISDLFKEIYEDEEKKESEDIEEQQIDEGLDHTPKVELTKDEIENKLEELNIILQNSVEVNK